MGDMQLNADELREKIRKWNKDDHITNIQQARAIIRTVGEPYQRKVIELLREQTCYVPLVGCEIEAKKVIKNMEHEYTLNIANVLWKDRFEDIPEYIKNYS